MDEVTWGALTLTLTLLAGLWTWFAFRRRGVAAGLRGAGLTLLPAAAWLTGTLELLTEIAGSVADWAVHLVFSPVVWLGIVLAGLAVVLLGAGSALGRRTGSPRSVTGARETGGLPAAGPRRGAPAIDEDLAEIEALLRKRGIT